MFGAKLLINKLHGEAFGDRTPQWLYLPVEMPEGWNEKWRGEEYTTMECKKFREATAQAVKDQMPSIPGIVVDPADYGHSKGCKWQVKYDQDGPVMNFGRNLWDHVYILVKPLPLSATVPISEYERISIEG